ncbi:hypothetical protein M8C13_42625 [Crossiella sp. SN42]|uniref:hypothetical protein n=1 Tax=Crossiella sp. SN42 TaxID=2944808 RepID=UPI00207CEA3B|nr:hypothetical protein [Crossiella sp. SN42]MCO1582462.1 hypothetical protein [Crossiella sp. SN42]
MYARMGAQPGNTESRPALALQRFTMRGDQVLADVVLADPATAAPLVALPIGAVNEHLPVHRAVPVTVHGVPAVGERLSVRLGNGDGLPACVATRPRRIQPRLVELNPGYPPRPPADGRHWQAAYAVPVIGSHGRCLVLGDPATGGPVAAAALRDVAARQLVAAEAVLVGYDPAEHTGLAAAVAGDAAALLLRAWPGPLPLRHRQLRLRRSTVSA